jgi:excisionase family DNA binding protein
MKFLTVEEVADRLRVSTDTVREWAKSGRLEAHRPGRRFLFTEEALGKFIQPGKAAKE